MKNSLSKRLRLLLLVIPTAMIISGCGNGGESPTSGDASTSAGLSTTGSLSSTTGTSLTSATSATSGTSEASSSSSSPSTSGSTSTAHTHNYDEHGVCSCGDYEGDTYDEPGHLDITKGAGQDIFFRVNVEAGKTYETSAEHIELIDDMKSWIYVTSWLDKTESWPLEIPTGANYIYFYFHFATGGTLSLDLFEYCPHSSKDIFGFCNDCHAYAGGSYDTPGLVVVPPTTSGEKQFNRFKYNPYGVLKYFFVGNAEDTEHTTASISVWIYDKLGNRIDIGSSYNTDGNILTISHGQLSGCVDYIYTRVDYSGYGTLSGNYTISPVGFDGFDEVEDYKNYYGQTLSLGVQETINNDYITKWYDKTEERIVEHDYCFKLESLNQNDEFQIVTDAVNPSFYGFYLSGDTKESVTIDNEGHFTSPINGDLYFVITSENPLYPSIHITVNAE